MTFAIPFFRDFKYLENPSTDIQLNIKYKPRLRELEDFLTKFSNYRINILIPQEDFDEDRDLNFLYMLYCKSPNLVAVFPYFTQELEQKVTSNGIPHFYNLPIVTWEDLNGFLSLNVTDVILDGEILFALKDLAPLVKASNKRIRCTCNQVSSLWKIGDPLVDFFIQPEDIDFYSQYIDTFTFAADTPLQKINIYYKIYAVDKKWTGKLKDIIINYKGEQNSHLPSTFAEKRVRCNKNCIKNPGYTCRSCRLIYDFNNTYKIN